MKTDRQSRKYSPQPFISIFLVALIFFGVSMTAQYFQHDLKVLIDGQGALGMLSYIALSALAVIFAPFSSLPLVPVASMLWGWAVSGALSICGWFFGAWIVFIITRRYGVLILKSMASNAQLTYVAKIIPDERNFIAHILLRMTIPVDILSYALALFSNMSLARYLLTTLIGIAPFSFVIAYTGTLPPLYQLSALCVLIIMITVSAVLRHR